MDLSNEVVTVKDGVIKVKAGIGYYYPGKTLLKLKDTGNGYLAKFPSHSTALQDNYVCLDYNEAHVLWLALSKLHGPEGMKKRVSGFE